MKRLAVASLFVSVGAFVACAVEEAAPPEVNQGGTGQGGAAGSGVGGTAQAGSSVGGTAPVGGTSGAGPQGGAGMGGTSTAGMAGTPVTGGSGGAGATAGMGGTAGDGMAGSPGGMGGDGTAGSAQGGMGGDGMAGMSGSGGGAAGGPPACPTVAELFPAAGNLGSLDGRLVTTPCVDSSTDDCAGAGWIYNGTTTGCSGGALNVQQDFMVGGTPGTMYEVTMHFYGVMEPKNYGNNVQREAGGTRPQNLASGATPVPWATANAGVTYQGSDYNTYEIHVMDEDMQEVRQYFINSDTTEGHWTYAINYEKTIPVVGGGRIRIRTYDRNCRQIKNCGTGGTPCADKARTVDVAQAMPQPSGLQQPGLGRSSEHSGQWWLIDVTAVACM